MKIKVTMLAALVGFGVNLGASPADAQYRWGYEPYYSDYAEGLSARQISRIVRSRGLRPVSRPARRGDLYSVLASDDDGRVRQVMIDAVTGDIVGIDRGRGRAGPRRYSRGMPPEHPDYAMRPPRGVYPGDDENPRRSGQRALPASPPVVTGRPDAAARPERARTAAVAPATAPVPRPRPANLTPPVPAPEAAKPAEAEPPQAALPPAETPAASPPPAAAPAPVAAEPAAAPAPAAAAPAAPDPATATPAPAESETPAARETPAQEPPARASTPPQEQGQQQQGQGQVRVILPGGPMPRDGRAGETGRPAPEAAQQAPQTPAATGAAPAPEQRADESIPPVQPLN